MTLVVIRVCCPGWKSQRPGGLSQDQLVGRGLCLDTDVKRLHGHLGSWAQDVAVCGRTCTSRVQALGLGEGEVPQFWCLYKRLLRAPV